MILLLSALGFRAQGWFETGFESSSVFFLGLAVYMSVGCRAVCCREVSRSRYGEFRHFVRSFEIWGFVIAGIGVYILSWITLWRELQWWYIEDSIFSAVAVEYWLFFAAFIIFAGAGMLLVGRISPREVPDSDRDRWELAGVFGIVGIAILTLVSLIFAITWVWVVFNVIVLLGVIAMINAGIRFNRGYLVNIAFILFGVTVLTRYFEIAAIFEILDQAVSFIVAGVLLIVMALGLERLRKNLLGRMRSEGLDR